MKIIVDYNACGRTGSGDYNIPFVIHKKSSIPAEAALLMFRGIYGILYADYEFCFLARTDTAVSGRREYYGRYQETPGWN